MKVVVKIPLGLHSDLVSRCELKSPEYRLLKNGIIEDDADRSRAVHILCATDIAQKILKLAGFFFPQKVDEITVSQDLLPEQSG